MTLLGQPHVVRYLENGLKTHRLSPSLLFAGPDGVGKKKAALLLARTYLCSQNPGLAFGGCGRCDACVRTDARNHSDLLFADREWQLLMLKEKSANTAIRIETVREIEKFLQLKPFEGRARLAVLDEAELMTTEAANAFLKVLEEPPNNAAVILLTVDERNLLTTIRSRCAILRFRAVPAGDVAAWLETERSVPRARAEEVADRAGGSFARAIEILGEEGAQETAELADYTPPEYFEAVSSSLRGGDGRKRAQTTINHLIEAARAKLETGDLEQAETIRILLGGRRRLERNVPPRLVLEDLYVRLSPRAGAGTARR